MLEEILFRFFIGGALVSIFSLLGSLFKQRSFGGLFGAAPSVALATLSLTVRREGAPYASFEARSMIAAAFLVYAGAVTLILAFYRTSTLRTNGTGNSRENLTQATPNPMQLPSGEFR